MIGRYLGNILIIVFTLGLGLPIAIHRTMLFLSRNIEIIGEIDGSEITRAELPRPEIRRRPAGSVRSGDFVRHSPLLAYLIVIPGLDPGIHCCS